MTARSAEERSGFRPPVVADAEAVLALLVERDIADIGTPDITLGDIRDEWSRGDFDLRCDARVAEAAGGRIVGYAAMTGPMILAVVAPDHEGQGIGTRLRRWAEQRDRVRGSVRHRQWIASTNERALLLATGDSEPRCSSPPWRASPRRPPGGPTRRGLRQPERAQAVGALRDDLAFPVRHLRALRTGRSSRSGRDPAGQLGQREVKRLRERRERLDRVVQNRDRHACPYRHGGLLHPLAGLGA